MVSDRPAGVTPSSGEATTEGRSAERIGVTPSREGLLVGFRVSPSARRTRIQGVYGDRIKVHVSAPPEDDKANVELTAAVAAWLDLSAGCVSVHSGHRTKNKQLAVSGIGEAELRGRLQRLLEV